MVLGATLLTQSITYGGILGLKVSYSNGVLHLNKPVPVVEMLLKCRVSCRNAFKMLGEL